MPEADSAADLCFRDIGALDSLLEKRGFVVHPSSLSLQPVNFSLTGVSLLSCSRANEKLYKLA